MDNEKSLVDLSTLKEMLYGEETYIKEFTDAAVISFSEFKEHYSTYLLQRDEVSFRKAGHKIKPVAQMLGLDLIIEEYENAKTLLWDEKSDDDLVTSSKMMEGICDRVIKELTEHTD